LGSVTTYNQVKHVNRSPVQRRHWYRIATYGIRAITSSTVTGSAGEIIGLIDERFATVG
jgi:hypothetical protein